MRPITNLDTRISSTHCQNPGQEASVLSAIPTDAELNELFSFHDDPDFLADSAQGRAELRQLVLKDDTLDDVPASISSMRVRDQTTTRLQYAELLEKAANGDPTAWGEILRRYSGLVTARVRAFRLQDADALDAIQTTWLRLAENIHRIQHPERLGGWLVTTASRECLHTLYQTKRTQSLTDAIVNHTTDLAPSPEQRVIDAHTTQTLRSLIAELPPRHRRLLRTLFTDHPRSDAEVSRVTRIPLGSISPIRNRALHELRQKLKAHRDDRAENAPTRKAAAGAATVVDLATTVRPKRARIRPEG
jgi:RNA polymerase sigma factor (sigma-70 family)